MKNLIAITKKKIAAAVLSIILICGITTGVLAASGNLDFFNFGALLKSSGTDHNNDKSIYMKGDSIVIYQDELDNMVAQYELFGYDNPSEQALQYLLSREAVYNLALKENQLATEEETQRYIQDVKDGLASSDAETKENYEKMVAGTGLSEEAYWDSMFDRYQKDLTNNKYYSKWQRQVIEENPGKSSDEVMEIWNLKQQEIVQQLIDDDHVQIIEGR